MLLTFFFPLRNQSMSGHVARRELKAPRKEKWEALENTTSCFFSSSLQQSEVSFRQTTFSPQTTILSIQVNQVLNDY